MFKTAFFLAPFFILTQLAVAQTSDELRDPEVQLPSPPAVGQPCLIDPAALRDSRINRGVLNVIRTNPYFAVGSKSLKIRRSVVVKTWNEDNRKYFLESKYRPLGCGFYVFEKTLRGRDAVGVDFSDAETGLLTPAGFLFHERAFRYNGKVSSKDWTQTTNLEIIGDPSSVVVGSKYGLHRTTTTKSALWRESVDCEVMQEKPATEFYFRLTGRAILSKCKVVTDQGSGPKTDSYNNVRFPDVVGDTDFNVDKCHFEWRVASELYPKSTGNALVAKCSGSPSIIYLKDVEFAFDPDNCRLEIRAAAEFNLNLRGDAYTTRCGVSNYVYFPELGSFDIKLLSFEIDSIDGSFRAFPYLGSRLTDIEQAP